MPRKMLKKTRVFVASSKEALPIAAAIKKNLEERDRSILVEIWTDLVGISKELLQELLSKAAQFDFAVFVFRADDEATIRDDEVKIVRDNVLFELGIFLDAIGRDRCFIVAEDNPALRFPVDIRSLTHAKYRHTHTTRNWAAQTQDACGKILKEIKEIKEIGPHSADAGGVPSVAVTAAFNSWNQLSHLAAALRAEQAGPEGLTYQLLNEAHRLAQDIADAAWVSVQKVSVTFKQLHPDKTRLKCIYLTVNGRHTTPAGKKTPETIPLDGSASGAVFENGVPAIAEDVESGYFTLLNNGFEGTKMPFNKKLKQEISGRVKSVAAWPVIFQGETVCVVKCDSGCKGFFKIDGRTQAVMELLVATFQHALVLAQSTAKVPRRTNRS